MKNLLYCSIIFLSYVTAAYAQMGPGTTCPSTAPCYVIMSGGGGDVTVDQGVQAASAAGSTWFTQQYLGGSAVSLTNPVPVTPGTGSTFPVSGTVAATQSGTWNINSVTTLPSITVSSSVLPTGASTATNQTSVQSAPGTPQTTALTVQGNASGVALPVSASALPLPSGASTATNQTNVQSAPGTPQTTALTVQGNASGVALPVSASSLPLPTGASTATNQTVVQSAPGTPQTTALTVQGNDSGIALPVNIVTSSPNRSMSYASPLANVSVPTSSTQILAAGTYTKYLTLCTATSGGGNVWLNLNGGAAVSGRGMYIPKNGCLTNIYPPTAAIFGISDAMTSTVSIQGG